MASDLDGICVIKRGGKLTAADLHADEFFARIKDGSECLVTIRRPRNIAHHRLLFAALHKVVENTDQWPSVEALLDELKLATGHAEVRVNLLTGKPYAVPASINFAAMPQDKFAAWFDQVVQILSTKALKIAPEALRREIMDMVEPRASA